MMNAHRTIGLASALALALMAATSSFAAQHGAGEAQGGNRGQLSEGDYKFVRDAARGGLMEVQLGQIAEQKGASPAVRQFGQTMVQDHTKANDELRQIATQKGATLPTQMSHHEQSTMNELEKLSGKEFDQTYAKDMTRDHRHDVKEFEKEAKNVRDPDLRAWAQKTLPVLQQHLQLAEQMESQVKNEK